MTILAVTGLFVVAHDLFRARGAVQHEAQEFDHWSSGDAAVLARLRSFGIGHNRIHHAFTVRQGYDYGWHPVTAQEYADKSRFGKVMHRIEWSWMGTGFYFLLEVWWHKMIAFKPPARWIKAIRRDRLTTLSFIVLMALGFGALGYARSHSILGALWLVGRVEIIPFIGFCVMIGSVIMHHGNPTSVGGSAGNGQS